jgi:hypothetical protein
MDLGALLWDEAPDMPDSSACFTQRRSALLLGCLVALVGCGESKHCDGFGEGVRRCLLRNTHGAVSMRRYSAERTFLRRPRACSSALCGPARQRTNLNA